LPEGENNGFQVRCTILGKKLRRAVFLDRDGTLNKLVYYSDLGIVDSPFLPSQLSLVPGAAKAMANLRKKGFLLVLASNQPGVAKGNMGKKDFIAIDRKLDLLLAGQGASLDAKYYCTHHPKAKLAALRKNCPCRKPKPGMLFKAALEHGIDLKRSYMVGDGISDIRAGRAAGCRTVFVGHFKPELWKYFKGGKRPDIVAKDIGAAERRIR
jgi:D-glycero-D-manno-heptose 1,7-bisphosphate phosphatase